MYRTVSQSYNKPKAFNASEFSRIGDWFSDTLTTIKDTTASVANAITSGNNAAVARANAQTASAAGGGMDMMPILLIGAVGLGAYLLIKRKKKA